MSYKKIVLFVALIASIKANAQLDSTLNRISFQSDFRFRIEQDWHSKKSDGSLRDDRTRFRYRLRFGAKYGSSWYETGFRIRTGNPNKQQDPQLTLGKGQEEFSIIPIGFEKLYFKGKWKSFNFWVGKNTYPFNKNNELFWSDNVYPEGVFFNKGFESKVTAIDTINVKAGHFIISSNGKALDKDAYYQAYQLYFSFCDENFELFPSINIFKNLPNIPDGGGNYTLDYSIFQIGSRINLSKNKLLTLELDYLFNLQDYSLSDSIPSYLKNQKNGAIVGLKYGKLSNKGDWLFKLSYANIQKFATVDYMAQNDWARWDYSSSGSPDGRLTNFQGIELVAGLKLSKKTALKMKYYMVEQLITNGITKENGYRVRFDLDVKF
jgi:hypothetical protein